MNVSLMEIPCYAGGILYMAFLYRYQKKPSLLRLFWVLAAGGYCALLRLSNVALFIPAIFILAGNKFRPRLFLLLAVYAAGVLALNRFVNAFISPYPDFMSSLSYCSSYGEVLSMVLQNGLKNLGRLLDPTSDKSLPQAFARYQYIFLLALQFVHYFEDGGKKYFISVHDIAGSAEAPACAEDLITAEDSLDELNRKINDPAVKTQEEREGRTDDGSEK